MLQPRLGIILLLVLLPAATRLIDHPWNLAPIGALSLFAGAYIRDKRWALFVPLAAMLLSDIALGVFRHNFEFWTFHPEMPIVYGSYAISICLGFGIRGYWDSFSKSDQRATQSTDSNNGAQGRPLTNMLVRKVLPIAVGTLAGAIQFFVVTNFGSWLHFYERSWTGLVSCYVAGLPFFRSTLMGDAFYVLVFFGGFEFAKSRFPAMQRSGIVRTD
jgi:hypothetical protein